MCPSVAFPSACIPRHNHGTFSTQSHLNPLCYLPSRGGIQVDRKIVLAALLLATGSVALAQVDQPLPANAIEGALQARMAARRAQQLQQNANGPPLAVPQGPNIVTSSIPAAAPATS